MNFVFKLVERCGVPQSFLSNVASILTANVVNNATIFAANIIIARNYGQDFFGLFSIAVNVSLLALTVSEFGMNYSMIRLYKKYLDDPSKTRSILLTNMYFKCFILLVLIILGLMFGQVIASIIMHDPDRWGLAALALTSGGVLGLWSFVRAYLQSVERFKAIAVQTIIYAFLRMAILAVMFLGFSSTSEELMLLAIYVMPLFLILWWGISQLKGSVKSFKIEPKELLKVGAETIKYSRWTALTGISFVIIQQSLIYIVSIIGGVKEVALLSAGLVFTAVFSLINDAICQVLFSKLAGLSQDRIGEYRRRLLRLTPLFVLGSLLIIIALSAIMILFLGEEYTRSLPIFWITGFGTALTACIGYYSMVMHTIQRPQIGAYVNLTTLVCFCLCGIVLMKYVSLLAVVVAYALALAGGEMVKSILVNRAVSKLAVHGV